MPLLLPGKPSRLLPGLILACLSLAAHGTPDGGASEPPPRTASPRPTGQVVASVTCLADPAQSYALYLPSRYTADCAWPILYAFDPGARGRDPVKLFRAAAERLGYIVACSNNARNGPLPPALAAGNAVWRDTHRRFKIDGGRVYATGFSGGAGLAVIFASRCGTGVIACAGALQPEYVEGIANGCAWISVAGICDYNYDFNRAIVKRLSERGVVARFAGFEGTHQWPPEEIATLALEFIHLSAMRSGRLPPDPKFVEAYAAQGRTRANSLVTQARADLAAEELEVLVRELAGLMPTESFAADAGRLRQTPGAREGSQHEKNLATESDRQLGVVAALYRRFENEGRDALLEARNPGNLAAGGHHNRMPLGAADTVGETGDDALVDHTTVETELWHWIDRLNRDCSSKNDDARIVATRVTGWLFGIAFPAAQVRREERKFDLAVDLFDVATRLRPTNSAVAYELARTYAAKGSRRRALAELKHAISLGFKQTARLNSDPEWAALRTDKEFTRLSVSLDSAPQTNARIN